MLRFCRTWEGSRALRWFKSWEVDTGGEACPRFWTRAGAVEYAEVWAGHRRPRPAVWRLAWPWEFGPEHVGFARPRTQMC